MNLAELLQPDAVPIATLEERYGALLKLVRKLIGVVPNCDPFLEIWPPAFRSYNVMVPNLLNLPVAVWAPNPSVGLAMYASSRVAACAYCSAHTCSFALRRGASVEAVAGALDEHASLTPADRAAIAIGRGLASVPLVLAESQRAELLRHFSPAKAEWIVHGVAMMGFLNKMMDALGIPLEPSTVQEVSGVIASSGWRPGKHGGESEKPGAPPRADGLGTKLGVVPLIPSALSLDRKWTAGVPDRWPAVGEFLRAKTGHDWPLLSRVRHRRAIRAVATMLALNLDASTSVVGMASKLAAGRIYAEVVGDASLAAELERLHAPGEPTPAALVLARAASPSPSQIDDAAIAAARTLPAAAIIEIVSFLSVLQLVHRLGGWFST